MWLNPRVSDGRDGREFSVHRLSIRIAPHLVTVVFEGDVADGQRMRAPTRKALVHGFQWEHGGPRTHIG